MTAMLSKNPFGPLRRLALASGRRAVNSALWRTERLSRELTYLQLLEDFQSSPDDIFIVTYPRSGTTLAQAIAHELRCDLASEFVHIDDVVPTFEDLPLRPTLDIGSLKRPRFFKTHHRIERLPRGCKYIYIARDPRDVAISTYHFFGAASIRTFDQFLADFVAGFVPFGSWFEHVNSALKHRGDPRVLFLTYEQLTTDLAGSAQRMAAFAGLPIDAARMRSIVHHCSHEYMQHNEHKFHPDFRTLKDQWRNSSSRLLVCKSFIRNGQAGSHRLELTASQQARFGDRLHTLKRQIDRLAAAPSTAASVVSEA